MTKDKTDLPRCPWGHEAMYLGDRICCATPADPYSSAACVKGPMAVDRAEAEQAWRKLMASAAEAGTTGGTRR